MRLEGKVALITGAATGNQGELMGFGGATAWLFVREGAKVVLSDINEGLGEKTAAEPFVASSMANPQDPYSESKHRAEIALREACASGNMDYVIVRPTLVIGDGASGNLDRLIKWVASGIPIMLGGISNQRSLVSVETLCQILIESLANSSVANRTILAADPNWLLR